MVTKREGLLTPWVILHRCNSTKHLSMETEQSYSNSGLYYILAETEQVYSTVGYTTQWKRLNRLTEQWVIVTLHTGTNDSC